MLYTEEQIIDHARRGEEPDTQEIEMRTLYWHLRCIIADFQLGKIDQAKASELKQKAIMEFRQDEKVGPFRKSEIAFLAESWIKIEQLTEEYRKHKTTEGADKILDALYNTEG